MIDINRNYTESELPEPVVDADWRWALIPTFFASGAISFYCLYVSARLIADLFHP